MTKVHGGNEGSTGTGGHRAAGTLDTVSVSEQPLLQRQEQAVLLLKPSSGAYQGYVQPSREHIAEIAKRLVDRHVD